MLAITSPSQAAPAADPAPASTTVASTTATSTVGGAIIRSEILDRAKFWVDQGVPYNQKASYRDQQGRLYRTDCSGLVSMAWHLPTSATTWTLPNYSTKLADLDDLKPGDALNDINSHVVLFVGWTDSTHTVATSSSTLRGPRLRGRRVPPPDRHGLVTTSPAVLSAVPSGLHPALPLALLLALPCSSLPVWSTS